MLEPGVNPQDVPVAVLGANGFLGSLLVDKLVQEGREVVALDRFSSRRPQFKTTPRSIVRVDFDEEGVLEEILTRGSQVIHAIGTETPWMTSHLASAADSIVQPQLSNILEACRHVEVSHLYFCSSGGAIYGEPLELKSRESEEVNPISIYGRAKLWSERAIISAATAANFKFTIWRFSNVYGPRQVFSKGQGLIPRAIEAAKHSTVLPVYGDGLAVRDFIFARDAIEIASIQVMGGHAGVYNIGTGIGASVREVISEIEQILNTKITTVEMESPKGFVRRNVLDISRLERRIGPFKFVELREGLRLTLAEETR